MLYKENDFFLIFEGGWESEVEGPAISLGSVGQLDMFHDSLIGPLLCMCILGGSGSTNGN